MLRTSIPRTLRQSTSLLSAATRRAQPQCLSIAAQQQSRQQHAVSNPTLANIEKRWEAMPPQEQAELWMALRDRMTVDWKELTTQEKKACKYAYCGIVIGN
jgi:cytochrome c oxidase subunit 4